MKIKFTRTNSFVLFLRIILFLGTLVVAQGNGNAASSSPNTNTSSSNSTSALNTNTSATNISPGSASTAVSPSPTAEPTEDFCRYRRNGILKCPPPTSFLIGASVVGALLLALFGLTCYNQLTGNKRVPQPRVIDQRGSRPLPIKPQHLR